jgi:class 3 adenylate cyclase
VTAGDGSLDDLLRERDQYRRRLDAIAGVLHAMTHGGMRLQPILDQIVEAAAQLCHADTGFLYLTDGDVLRMGANFGQPAEQVEYERKNPHTPGMDTCTGRVAITKRPVHIPDIIADPDYSWPAADVRTLLGLPVMLGEELVGVFGLARGEVAPYDQTEIELMTVFADQCAAAIANSRLFETVERQKAELARFLSPEVAALVSSDDGAQLLAGHRAYITVVYFDLRGFTAFAEAAEPEELIEVIRQYHAAAGELVTAHRGTLEHFAGDGLMVFFNDPLPVEDHELAAARLAVALRERIGELAAEWRKLGYDLGLGAGIASGHATLGRIGFEGRYDYGALGTVTNLASRLCDEAAGGQILVNQRAHAGLEDHVDARDAGERAIKGFARPLRVFELTGLR